LRFQTSGGPIPTLSEAYVRYNELIFPHRAATASNKLVSTVQVNVEDRSEAYPQLETDESYTLTVGEQIVLSAKTVYGALRGLESLSQLIMFDFDTQSYVASGTPIAIEDAPRYPHRGLLLDTARHYQPIPFIKKTIDSLSYAKYNVFHWHVVDTQSFPFESKSSPKLWSGAYTKPERYSQEDIKEVVEYARLRGVKVMIEFDMPGHAASWCAGYPDICPSATCKQPLNPASNATFPLITSLLAECTAGTSTDDAKALFPYGLLHLGGDEVNYSCWESSAQIQAWEKAQGYQSSEEVYKFFVDKVATITREQGRTPVQWVEVFEHFGDKLDKNTIVHVWKAKSTLDGVLKAGYKALLSNEDDWYLDHLPTTWQTMYLNEPTFGLSEGSDPALIMGGESCMWGETVDASDLHNTVWPRAAAVSEVLWTAYDTIYPTHNTSDVDLVHVGSRLETFRCLLNQRGISAAPVTNAQARYQPVAPGSCYMQRR